MSGGPGGDQLSGQEGDDVIRGRAGDDRIDCGGGNDVAWGNGGKDTFVTGSFSSSCTSMARPGAAAVRSSASVPASAMSIDSICKRRNSTGSSSA